ncbi:MAG: GAF domain-containing protein, partial [bacterium]
MQVKPPTQIPESAPLEPIAQFVLSLNEGGADSPTALQDRLLHRLAEFLNCKAVLLYLPTIEGSNVWLDVRAIAGPEAGRIHASRIARGEELAGKAFAFREGRLFSRVGLAPTDAQKAIQAYKQDAQSVMCIPVLNNQTPMAVFEVYDRVDGKYFTADDFKSFTFLTRFLIPHLQYLSALSRGEADRDRLDRLSDIAQQIGLQRSLDVLIPLVESMSKELAHADASALFLLNEDTQELAAASLPKH